MAIYDETLGRAAIPVVVIAFDVHEQNAIDEVVRVAIHQSAFDWKQDTVFNTYNELDTATFVVVMLDGGPDSISWDETAGSTIIASIVSGVDAQIINGRVGHGFVNVRVRLDGPVEPATYDLTAGSSLIAVHLDGIDTSGESDYSGSVTVAVTTTGNASQTHSEVTGATFVPVMTQGTLTMNMFEVSDILRVSALLSGATSQMLFANPNERALIEVVISAEDSGSSNEDVGAVLVHLVMSALDAMDWGLPTQTWATIHLHHPFSGTAYLTQ